VFQSGALVPDGEDRDPQASADSPKRTTVQNKKNPILGKLYADIRKWTTGQLVTSITYSLIRPGIPRPPPMTKLSCGNTVRAER